MPIRRTLVLAALLILPSAGGVHAVEADPAYVELADSPTITVDWSKGSTQSVTLHGNRALTFSNGQKGGKYTLVLKQDATGSRTITWPSTVHWPGVYGPTLTTTAGKADYIVFIYNGVNYDMVALSQGF